MIPVATANLAIWTGIGGMLSGILIRAVLMLWEFTMEIFIDVTGLRITKTRGVLPNTIHNAIMHHAFGLKQTYRTEKMAYPYGMFISFKHRFCGVLTIEPEYGQHSSFGARFTVTILSFTDVMPLLHQSMNDKLQIYMADSTNTHQNIIIDVPTPNAWQRNATEYVDNVFERKTSGGLVILITGYPGCGKSTFPYIYAHHRQMPNVNVTTINSHIGATAVSDPKCMVIFNEIDAGLPINADSSNMDRWSGRRTSKDYFNGLMDIMHASMTAGIIVMTTNKSFAELCEQIPDSGADSMFRHGRLDIIFNVTHDLRLEIVREYKPVANKPPEPFIVDTPILPPIVPAVTVSETPELKEASKPITPDRVKADTVNARVNVDITVGELIDLLRKSQKDA